MTETTPTALITGAGRGIGLAIAQRLAPTHQLVLLGRDPARLEAAARAIDGGIGVEIVQADLAAQAPTLAVCDTLATRRVDVLVNNAGLAHSAPLHRTSDDDWARILTVDLWAPFVLARALAPGMAKRGFGRVISVASTAALKGYAYTAAYSAAKAGLVGMTRALAREYADRGVTFNAVCPGFVDTDIVRDAVATITSKTGRSEGEARASLAGFNPQGRLLAPTEIADLVAWLAAPAAGSVTGQAWAIDGGETT
jgi:NAD(P)-dependent dehydrogenase (short-subunit alcohol dehydrogenase family)